MTEVAVESGLRLRRDGSHHLDASWPGVDHYKCHQRPALVVVGFISAASKRSSGYQNFVPTWGPDRRRLASPEIGDLEKLIKYIARTPAGVLILCRVTG